jgi:CubicO group peptidase (beta-lactamase class C family)
MKKLLIALFLIAFLVGPLAPTLAESVPAKSFDYKDMDAAITAQMDKHGLPGVAVAVIEGEEIVYLNGYGTAGKHVMTPETQMFIGSLSKSFTALIIAQLAEQDKIKLNAPVQQYIPWFEVADQSYSDKITINHLLHHTSGLSESGYSVMLSPNTTSEEATHSLAQAQPTAPLGREFQYFNLGYDVLTYIIERVTGEHYADYLQNNILNPLGMTHSTGDPAAATDLSRGYTRLFGFAIPMMQQVRDYAIGSGYIVSSAEDMAKYALAIKNEANGLISTEMYRLMMNPGLGSYGMGWHIADKGTKIFHGGANETFTTHVNIYPKADRAFVLLINEGHQLDHLISSDQMMKTVEAVVLGKTPPVFQGWSVRWIGWGIGILVVALILLHVRNFYKLFNGWRQRALEWTPLKKILDVAISFIIPSVILIIVLSQIKAFYGYRFNFLTSLAYLRLGLPDIFILMLIGSLPDYIQGIIKLTWVVMDRTKSA